MKMPEQTHSGNLNRTKVAAQPEEGTKSAGKDNSPEASLRKGSLPQSSNVTTVSADTNKGLAKKLAGDNDNGNPKHRTTNVHGGPTVKGTGKES